MGHPFGSTVRFLEYNSRPVFVPDPQTVPLVLKNGVWEPEYDLEKFIEDSSAISEEEFRKLVAEKGGQLPEGME